MVRRLETGDEAHPSVHGIQIRRGREGKRRENNVRVSKRGELLTRAGENHGSTPIHLQRLVPNATSAGRSSKQGKVVSARVHQVENAELANSGI